MQRTILGIGNRDFLLAQNADLNDLKERAVAAIRAGAGTVNFVVVGNRAVDVVVSAGVALVFETTTVAEDDRDTGDIGFPFDEALAAYDL